MLVFKFFILVVISLSSCQANEGQENEVNEYEGQSPIKLVNFVFDNDDTKYDKKDFIKLLKAFNNSLKDLKSDNGIWAETKRAMERVLELSIISKEKCTEAPFNEMHEILEKYCFRKLIVKHLEQVEKDQFDVCFPILKSKLQEDLERVTPDEKENVLLLVSGGNYPRFAQINTDRKAVDQELAITESVLDFMRKKYKHLTIENSIIKGSAKKRFLKKFKESVLDLCQSFNSKVNGFWHDRRYMQHFDTWIVKWFKASQACRLVLELKNLGELAFARLVKLEMG